MKKVLDLMSLWLSFTQWIQTIVEAVKKALGLG